MIVYHCTLKSNLTSISEKGLLPNSNPNFTDKSFLDELNKIYGKIPIFCSLTKDAYKPIEQEDKSKYCLLKLDISGLDYGADFGVLMDFGAYYEEGDFYFKDGEYIVEEFLDGEQDFTYDDLLRGSYVDKFIKATKTLVVLEAIFPDRILSVELLN